jgi:hypothetical protein
MRSEHNLRSASDHDVHRGTIDMTYFAGLNQTTNRD